MFASSEKSRTFASLLKNKRHRAFSSAGSEHLPYKQRVGGSNPSTPTKHRGVEQLVARWAHNPKVVCSSQASATNLGRSNRFSFFLCLFANYVQKYFPIICMNQRKTIFLHTYICNVQ